MAGRRAARRTALFLLYQWDLTGQPLTSLYEGDIDEFSRELAEAVSGEAAELDRMIDVASDEWRADRLGVLERNVMRIGIYELVHGTVPVEVAISEAVNLAKRYASDEAGKLVNGVLARVRAGAGGVVNADVLQNAEQLLAQLEAARAKLEQTEEPTPRSSSSTRSHGSRGKRTRRSSARNTSWTHEDARPAPRARRAVSRGSYELVPELG